MPSTPETELAYGLALRSKTTVELADEARLLIDRLNRVTDRLRGHDAQVEVRTIPFTMTSAGGTHLRFNQFEVAITRTEVL